MEELLLPNAEEEARSDHSTYVTGDAGRTMGDRVKTGLKKSLNLLNAVKDFLVRNGLLTLSVVAVVCGCTMGFLLRGTQLSTQAKIYFSFPGELLMRMLKMLILPLITSR
ncbi:hypothetical protein KUCAC02_022743 [Chaenocephalus aceratus]|uniref:Uncharacterized protein n=1 Tax=Chaenocephalus aceratus TaxID=36190 RepID=A0ACB9XMW9_CHAAC|nr:hypothetical protein KUCAC02_022743 [Chaenocephalus aceratus]